MKRKIKGEPETIPLFAVPRRTRTKINIPEREKAITSGTCPRCHHGTKRVGLLRTPTHLVWRPHTYTTWSGAPMSCPASGIALCQLPDPGGQLCDCQLPPALRARPARW